VTFGELHHLQMMYLPVDYFLLVLFELHRLCNIE